MTIKSFLCDTAHVSSVHPEGREKQENLSEGFSKCCVIARQRIHLKILHLCVVCVEFKTPFHMLANIRSLNQVTETLA